MYVRKISSNNNSSFSLFLPFPPPLSLQPGDHRLGSGNGPSPAAAAAAAAAAASQPHSSAADARAAAAAASSAQQQRITLRPFQTPQSLYP